MQRRAVGRGGSGLALALALACACQLPTIAGEDEAGESNLPWVTHQGDGWVFAAPRGWRDLGVGLEPPKALHLTGDGIGLPGVDGVFKPLQVGLSLDCYAQGAVTPQAMVDSIVETAKGTPTLRPRSSTPPVAQEITLADGTKAWFLTAEFGKPGGRLSVYARLVTATAAGRTVVVSSWAVGSAASGPFLKASGIRDLLETYARSLVLDGSKLDGAALRAAHRQLNAEQLRVAFAETRKGNAAIGSDSAAAVAAFERALRAFAHMPAAQNGLAWVLLTSADPSLIDVPRALELAKQAAAGTDRLDADTLDTLALALHTSGAKAEAVEAIKEAITLSPGNPSLKKALKRYQADSD